ncbi:protein LSM12 homolog [Chrysoperla carnea]|uniref:protein LSM12 homolog n=1 Tax=Chrysoperla carnea TaxID=189513 RepID=UPI001D088AD5|nr:protein LSM12 homolog [Chrysoperla carnea]
MATANCRQVMGDCFTIGSIVICKTCYNQEIEGEVVAFDPQSKMLILKCPSTCGNVNLNDVNIVNLSLVSDVQVKQEGNINPEPVQSLNLQRLNTRIRNSIDEKRRMVSALSAGVSPDGQRLFMQISKLINDEVTWRGSDIVVWQEEVIISPPYGLKDIRGNAESKEFTYIKKVVEKHLKDQAAAGNSPTNSGVNNLVGSNQSSVTATVGQQ